MVTVQIALLPVVALAFALLSVACATSRENSTPGVGSTSELRGVLVYLDGGGVRLYSNPQSDSCVEVEVRIPEYGTQFETVQNAPVTIRDFVESESSTPCGRSISVDSASDIVKLGEPQPISREQFTDDLAEDKIESVDEIRTTAMQLVRSVVDGDYARFRSLLWRDDNLEQLEKMRGNDPVRRRFEFIRTHATEFFGAAKNPAGTQILVRRYAERQSATACVCRRIEGCKHSDTFDAPARGSWGDPMFCFQLKQQADAWKVADPIFR